jgi:hypothetical protein
MYGGMNPFGDPNINQRFEIPGGGMGDFASSSNEFLPGLGGGSSSDSNGGGSSGSGSTGTLAPGPGAAASGTSSAGCGNNAIMGGIDSLLKMVPGNPGLCGTTPSASSGSQCSTSNIQACFTEFFNVGGDFFSRAAVVVVGFIFVAAGLMMFGRTVPFVRHAVPNVLKP